MINIQILAFLMGKIITLNFKEKSKLNTGGGNMWIKT